MCTWKCPLLILSAAAVIFTVGQTLPASANAAQPEKKATQPEKKPGKDAKPSEAEMAAMMPGPEHKILEGMVGTWTGDVKIWMAPGEEPKTSHGTCKREMGFDGRYLVEHIDADPIMPMPGGSGRFKGMGITGYNTIEKKYESIWIDNTTTWMMNATGKYDAAKKTLTFEGDCLDPATGKPSHHRDVLDLSSPDRQTSVGYCNGPDGKEFKCFEGVFTKK